MGANVIEASNSTLGDVWMIVRDLKRLQTLAVIQEVSHRDIAKAVWGNKSHSYVSRIMRGDVRSLTPEAAVRWAAFFGVAVDDLFVARASNNPRRSDEGRAA